MSRWRRCERLRLTGPATRDGNHGAGWWWVGHEYLSCIGTNTPKIHRLSRRGLYNFVCVRSDPTAASEQNSPLRSSSHPPLSCTKIFKRHYPQPSTPRYCFLLSFYVMSATNLTASQAIPLALPWSQLMSSTSTSDVVILALGVTLAAAYLFRDQIFSSKPKSAPVAAHSKIANGGGNPRDFIAKMKEGVCLHVPSFLCPRLLTQISLSRKSAW